MDSMEATANWYSHYPTICHLTVWAAARLIRSQQRQNKCDKLRADHTVERVVLAPSPLSVSTDPRRGLVHWQFGFIILFFAGKAPEFRIPAQDSSLRMIPKLDKTCVCVLPQIRQLSSRGQLNRGKIVKFTEN